MFLSRTEVSLAEYERELISERTKAGLASARARGRNGGRKYDPYQASPSTRVSVHDFQVNNKIACQIIK